MMYLPLWFSRRSPLGGWTILLLLSSLSIHPAHGKQSEAPGNHSALADGYGGEDDSPEVLECRLTVLATTYAVDSLVGIGPVKTNTTASLGCIRLSHADGSQSETSQILPFACPRDKITRVSLSRIARGNWRASVRGASIRDGEVILEDGAAVIAYEEEMDEKEQQRHRRASATSGTKSVFVVRVSAPDSSPVKSLSEMLSAMFSTQTTSFRSQYQACSFGKLVWRSAGGMDVTLDSAISSYRSSSQLADEAIRKVEARAGRPINTLADKIVLCQPPGSGSWIALATVNGWRVNINDTGGFCLSLSTLMHEVGHTLGLLHSGEGSEDYGDETGYMGYGYKSSTSPRKCFNGHKSFQLGWYSDRVLTVNPSSGRRKFKLATFVDYSRTASDEPVIISIMGVYFLQYNRAKGMNADTNEKANLVTVTENARSKSLSVAGLARGGRFTRSNFNGTGRNLVVAVCDRRNGGGTNGADIVVISIGYGQSFC